MGQTCNGAAFKNSDAVDTGDLCFQSMAALVLLLCAGFPSVSVMVQRLHLAPVRCGFWRLSSLGAQATTQESDGKAGSDAGQTGPEKGPTFARQDSRGFEGRPPKHRPGSGSLATGTTSMGPLNYSPDDMLSAVEPFGSQLLELQKLSGFEGRIQYTPTRNRQCHIYVITERLNARSAPLKRVFLR